jgi:hypothetical protein
VQILVELSFEKVKNVSSFAIHSLKKMRSRLCSQERWNPELVNAFGAAARYRRATAAAVMMTRTRIIRHSTRVKFTLFRCTSAELFFSCCASVAAPRQRPGHHDQVPAKNNERRRWHRLKHHDEVPAMHSERRHGRRPGATIKYLRCTASGAAGGGLGTTIKYLRDTAGIGLGNTLKYLRGAAGIGLGASADCPSSAATASRRRGNDLGTTIKYQRKTKSGAAGIGLGAPG